jgi:prepilin-type N-terminal cleavage/methylation domain-containing protein
MLTHLFTCRNVGLWQIPRESGGARRRFSHRGFSLVEITTVLVIIGVLAGITVPRFMDSDRRYRVDAAVRRLVDDIALMRQQARAKGAAQTMNISRAGYVIPTLISKDRGKTARYSVRWIDAPYSIQVAALTAAGNQITINASGDVTSTAEVTLQCGSYAKTVRIGNDGTVTVNTAVSVVVVRVEAAPDDVTAVVEVK